MPKHTSRYGITIAIGSSILEFYRDRFIGSIPLKAPAAKPLLRWAGGKHWLAPVLKSVAPKFGKYFEPFFGGGAVFFALSPGQATVSDQNEELVSMYEVVRDDVENLIRLLRGYPYTPGYFEKIKNSQPRTKSSRAARTIYLNRTCWNGLYRVNREGKFNTPFGYRTNPDIATPGRMRTASKILQNVSILALDFEAAVANAQAGDLVFLDPPYITGHLNNGFLMYNAQLFSWDDQLRLALCARGLLRRGVHTLISNADHPSVVSLYEDFYYYRIDRNSLIAGPVSSRGYASEALFSSFDLQG